MTARSRDSFSVRPRTDVSGVAAGDGVRAAGAEAAGAGAAACSAAAITSCLRIRPPTPVPETLLRSTPRSAASRRTSGVTYAPPPSPLGADGAAAAGGASCFGSAAGASCCGASCCGASCLGA